MLQSESRQAGHVLGVPIEIGGKPYVMAMVVREDENRHRLYVHEVVLREKLQAAFKTAASAGEQAPVELHGAKPGVVSADAAPRKTIRARKPYLLGRSVGSGRGEPRARNGGC